VEATCLALNDITVDSEIQQRANGLDPATVNDYAAQYEAGIEMPPIVAFQDKEETIWLSDGFHRFAAQELLGRESVDVDLRKGTRRDAILFACAANSSHGLRRTNADKRKAITTLLCDEAWAKRSDRWVAEKVGVHQTTVGTVRGELSNLDSSQSRGISQSSLLSDDDTPASEPPKTIGRDGKERTSKPQSAAKPAKDYPAWQTFQQYMMHVAGIQDGLLAKYDRSVANMVTSDDWDRARTVMAINYLDETIKVFQSLRKEFAKHAD